MMHYYKSISNNKFQKLKVRLISLENKIIKPFCELNSIRLDRERYYAETLAMNLYRDIEGTTDHIGFYFIDKKGQILFEFYFSKYFDTETKRYSYKKSLGQMNVESLEENLNELLKRADQKLKGLSKADLNDVVELSQ